MKCMTFLPKIVTIYFKEKIRFNYKLNYRRSKPANFCLDILNKINFKMLVVM